MPDVQTKFSGKKRKAPIPSKRMKAWTIIIPPVHTDICFSVNGEIPSLLTVTFRQCNSGVIFSAFLLAAGSHRPCFALPFRKALLSPSQSFWFKHIKLFVHYTILNSLEAKVNFLHSIFYPAEHIFHATKKLPEVCSSKDAGTWFPHPFRSPSGSR